MLFNSYPFIFGFLPVVLLVSHLLSRFAGRRPAMVGLVLGSLFFYGYWDPRYVPLILLSMAFNFGVARQLARADSRPLLTAGISTNLAALAYFKFAGFFDRSVQQFGGPELGLQDIVLPLAISFFTFQQIAFLVDAHRGETRRYGWLEYCLFVCFFPQLIAGPILHHNEILPQLERKDALKPHARNLAIGLSIFALGLFKKVVLADTLAINASRVFSAAEMGMAPSLVEAWAAALGYSLQLYFDFSGYSDMALGLAQMFGLRLPLNFDSPYKATSIIEFWRRWHITLSRFLRDYLYIPIGGNRLGKLRRYLNLMITMVLGGLWHGAGLTFILWGALHGIFLVINNLYRVAILAMGWEALSDRLARLGIDRLVTFVAVVWAWVIFRAESLDGALLIYAGLLGANGLMPFWDDPVLTAGQLRASLIYVAVLLLVVRYAPNVHEYLGPNSPAIAPIVRFSRHPTWQWRPGIGHAGLIACALAAAIFLLQRESEFLYFQF